MSIITTLTAPSPVIVTNPDPFVYGWRYVRKVGFEGELVHERVPLTLEDLLHPQEDDYRMHNFEHEQMCFYLNGVFQTQLAHDPTAVVLADVRIAWDKPNLLPHTPDITVVLGVQHRQNWSTFYEAAEGVRPILVVEVVSPTTRHIDLVDKLNEYEEAEVNYYIIVDSFKKRGQSQRRLLGYELTPDGYLTMLLDDQERLWLPSLGIALALNQALELECYNQAGELIPNYVNLSQAKTAVEARLTQTETRLTQTETRLTKAETLAKNESLARSQAESLAKNESLARAQAETRAQEAESRLRDLEAELRRLKGN